MGRRGIVPSAEIIGALFEPTLQIKTGQQPGSRKIFGAYVHQDRAVGIHAVAFERAHAVHADGPSLAGSRRDDASGAHAEGIDAATVFQVRAQFILRRWQARVSGETAVLRAVDRPLQVFDAKTDTERFLPRIDICADQDFMRIPRAVSNGQQCLVSADDGFTAAVGDADAAQPALFKNEPGQACPEQHTTAEGGDLFADGTNGGGQPVRADMRVCQLQDILRRAMRSQLIQDGAAERIFDASGQLAV